VRQALDEETRRIAEVTEPASLQIAGGSRVLPARAERSEPWTRPLQSNQPGSVHTEPRLRYNWRSKTRLTFARIIMRGKIALQLAAAGFFVSEFT
jgi:hypothetical protein